MTFETLQKNLQIVLDKANIKAGTKKGMLVECVYLVAMCDNNVHIPVAAEIMLMSGRSVAGYKPSTKTKYDIDKRVQLGYDHGEDVEETN
jgi:hypothetical protein